MAGYLGRKEEKGTIWNYMYIPIKYNTVINIQIHIISHPRWFHFSSIWPKHQYLVPTNTPSHPVSVPSIDWFFKLHGCQVLEALHQRCGTLWALARPASLDSLMLDNPYRLLGCEEWWRKTWEKQRLVIHKVLALSRITPSDHKFKKFQTIKTQAKYQ